MRNLVLLMVMFFSASTFADWEPSEMPEPGKILNDARDDVSREKYKDALSKYVWFFDNALKYDDSFYGVRLSYVLNEWKDLGSKYLPALDALRAARDKAGDNVRNGINYYGSFNDYESINEKLGEENKTVELFKWIDSHHADRAKKIYKLAQPTLVKAKEYKLCGKYLDPENAYLRYARNFHSMLDFYESNKAPKEIKDYAYLEFTTEVSTLVALLTINKRHSDAEEVAEMALLEWDDKIFSDALERALKGEVPKQWP